MKKRWARALAVLLALFALAGCAPAKTAPSPADACEITGDDLSASLATGSDWVALGLARSGRMTEAQKTDYYNRAAAFVLQNADEAQRLDRSKATENARLVLALTAAGFDPSDVAGVDLLQGLSDMDFLTLQGLGGPVWALIAFNCHGYEIPPAPPGRTQATREDLVGYILEQQLRDGGWTLNGESADADMTAMALLALAPYAEDKAVRPAVGSALACLSQLQCGDGDYAGRFSGPNSESCAQVVVALASLGVDPAADSRFCKDGSSVLDALMRRYAGGGFRHTADGAVDGMATEQAYLALVACARFAAGQSGLYDMSDVPLQKGGAPEP